MLFWLKKFISFWLMPLPFCLTVMIAGLMLLRWSRRRRRLGQSLVVGGVVLLALLSNKFVSLALSRPLERRYPPIPELATGAPAPAELAACRFIVVLGGGNGLETGASANNLLSSSALARIVEGVRLLRAVPDARLIVSGPGDPQRGPTHAEVLARTAESLGVPRARILKIETARDTEEEAAAVRTLAGDGRVAVVTSAWHLPRAIALCRHAGLEPLPCPTDYLSHLEDTVDYQDYLVDIDSLERSTWAVRERIGYLWIWLRGKT